MAIDMLVKRGMWKSHAYPLGHRVLRRFGVSLRPPPFSTGTSLAWGFSLYFAVAWGAVMAFIQPNIGITLLISAPLAGGLFGAFMALFYRKRAGELKLPVWEYLYPTSE
ncbi:MAG: hypothetical protein JKY60_03605 [Kordiimonadaceae bacterium]|nr:hypothetical protein [Kordiimonadaceae bacterium]